MIKGTRGLASSLPPPKKGIWKQYCPIFVFLFVFSFVYPKENFLACFEGTCKQQFRSPWLTRNRASYLSTHTTQKWSPCWNSCIRFLNPQSPRPSDKSVTTPNYFSRRNSAFKRPRVEKASGPQSVCWFRLSKTKKKKTLHELHKWD